MIPDATQINPKMGNTCHKNIRSGSIGFDMRAPLRDLMREQDEIAFVIDSSQCVFTIMEWDYTCVIGLV